MSKPLMCDCCGRIEPNIKITHQKKRKFQWFEVNWDSNGKWMFPCDICDKCWLYIGEVSARMQVRQEIK